MTWSQMEDLLEAALDEQSQLDIMAEMWERERVEAEEMESAAREGKYPAFLYESDADVGRS